MYKKFDLKAFKEKLDSGQYESRTGAMRAIGKTQELSEKEKDKARAMTLKHFGEDAEPAPKAKKAGKKAGKKVATKAPKAKKASKKAAKKAVVQAAEVAPVAAKKVVKKVAKKVGKRAKATPAPEGDTEASPAEGLEEPTSFPNSTFGRSSNASGAHARVRGPGVISEMGDVISTIGESLKAMQIAKTLFPKAVLEPSVQTMSDAMARAVTVIDKEVTGPYLDEEAPTAAVRKKVSKKGTRAKAQPATAPADEEAEPTDEQPAEEESAVEEASEGEADVGEGDSADGLSEEELEQLRIARETQLV